MLQRVDSYSYNIAIPSILKKNLKGSIIVQTLGVYGERIKA